MKELKKRKIRIGIGTDMTAYVQYRKLEAIGVTPYIDLLLPVKKWGQRNHIIIF